MTKIVKWQPQHVTTKYAIVVDNTTLIIDSSRTASRVLKLWHIVVRNETEASHRFTIGNQ